jgi:hypothetical protein
MTTPNKPFNTPMQLDYARTVFDHINRLYQKCSQLERSVRELIEKSSRNEQASIKNENTIENLNAGIENAKKNGWMRLADIHRNLIFVNQSFCSKIISKFSDYFKNYHFKVSNSRVYLDPVRLVQFLYSDVGREYAIKTRKKFESLEQYVPALQHLKKRYLAREGNDVESEVAALFSEK